jgi:ABC-type lipoprotein release transport system permease subunit
MRHRWLGIAVLILLVGIVGGAVMASVAGARRTSSSLSRFEAATNTANLEFTVAELDDEQLAAVRRIPNVVDVGLLRQLAMFNFSLGFLPTAGPIDDRWGRTIDQPRLLEGRLAQRADEVNIGPGLARRTHLRVGDDLSFQSFTPRDVAEQIGTTTFEPHGPSPVLRIVGIVRRPLDLGARGGTGGVIIPTAAFMEQYGDDIGTFSGTVLRVRTKHGDADAAAVSDAIREVFQGDESFGALGLGTEGAGAQSAIDVTTAALWILAVVSASAGAVAIAFAFARRSADEVDDQVTLRALGFARRQWRLATTAQFVPIAVGGAALGVLTAWFLSPVFPIGVARDAEPDLGLHFDAATLLVGAVATALAVLVIGALASAVVTRRRLQAPARPSVVSRALSDTAVTPPVAVGVGFALARGRGRSIPVWSTIGATTIGVVGVVAALVFAASLDRLVDTPARYGWTWGYVLDGYGDQGEACPRSDPVSHEPGVSAMAQFCFANDISVAGRPAVGSSIRQVRGRIDPEIVQGRAPRNPRELALGARLLESIGRSVGDQVVVSGPVGQARKKYDIVGTTVLPGLGEAQPLAGGALFTVGGLERVATDSPDVVDNYVIVRLEPDADERALLRRMQETHADLEPIPASVPAEIERLRQIDAFPALLAGLTVVIAAIALGYTLVVSVRRRRRDLAVLRTVGFTRGQVRAAVAWQATTLAGIGLALGIVLGFVVGERVWRAVADDLGVSPSIAVPVLGVVLVIPLTVLVANLIAAVPARSAARTPPAVVLRAE